MIQVTTGQSAGDRLPLIFSEYGAFIEFITFMLKEGFELHCDSRTLEVVVIGDSPGQ